MIKSSKHTASDMAQRGILLAYIESVVKQPEWSTADFRSGLPRSFRRIPEFGNRYLRVVHRPDGADIFVATVQWDRGASKP